MIFVILVHVLQVSLSAEDIRYVSIVFQIWRSLLINKVPLIPMESLFSTTIMRFDKLCSVFCFHEFLVSCPAWLWFCSPLYSFYFFCVCAYRKLLAYQTLDEKEERKNKTKRLAMILRPINACLFQSKIFSLFYGICFVVKYW